MKYCPKCKRMYNDEETNCSRKECKHKALESITDDGASVYLCSGDVVERDRVQAALEDSGIPSVYVRHGVSANSQVLTGQDFDGFDILVPYELYEKAYDTAVGIGAIKVEGEEIIEENPEMQADEEFEEKRKAYTHATPFTKESLLYREIFEKFYPGQSRMVKDFWMPNKDWEGCNVNDPSARVLSNYGASGV